MKRTTAKKTRPTAALLLFVLLLGAGGCGNRATVSGKVTFQGRPVTHGSVIFLLADGTAQSVAIQPDGSYQIENVPPGTAKIAVISRNPTRGRSTTGNRKPAGAGNSAKASAKTPTVGWFPLPARFESPESSGLRCEMASGQMGHDIEMK
jgi:hypothetical protein